MMRGRFAVVEALRAEGVRYVFGNPGTTCRERASRAMAAFLAGRRPTGRWIPLAGALLTALVLLLVTLAHTDVPVGAHTGTHPCNIDRTARADGPASLRDPRSTATPPGPVGNARVTGHGNRCLVLEWELPTVTGSAPLTGYHVQWRDVRHNNPWPEGSEVVTPGTAKKLTIFGLFNGREYELRIQACNGACGEWVAMIKDTPRTTPNQMTPPSLDEQNGALKASWRSPPNGGAEITDYKVQWGITEFNELGSHVVSRVVGGDRHYVIPRLTNGQAYWVRVRSRNSEGDGRWSDSAWGTPRASRPVTDPPGQGGDANLRFSEIANTVHR